MAEVQQLLAVEQAARRMDELTGVDDLHEVVRQALQSRGRASGIRRAQPYEQAGATPATAAPALQTPDELRVPSYATHRDTFLKGFKTTAAEKRVSLPLNPCSPSRIDQRVLQEWGWQEGRLLTWVGIVEYIDDLHGFLRDAEAVLPSPALEHYGHALVDVKWAALVPRKERGTMILFNYGFGVAKPGKPHARFVVDCRLNRALSKDASKTTFDRFEDAHEWYAHLRGGYELDGRSWYGQFEVDDQLSRCFGLMRGAVTLRYLVMPQGFAPAARVAHAALQVISRRAYAHMTGRVKALNYIDNHCVICRQEDAAEAKRAFAETAAQCSADFDLTPEWSTTVSFVGTVMSLAAAPPTSPEQEARTRQSDVCQIGIKQRWTVRAAEYVREALTYQQIDDEAALMLAGVLLWAARAMRRPLCELEGFMDWVRGRADFSATATREDILDLLQNAIERPRRLPPVPRRVQHVYVDAVPGRTAAMLWQPTDMPTQLDTSLRNPLLAGVGCQPVSAAVRVYHIDTPETVINMNELLSAYLALWHCEPGALVCLCTDNTNARGWLRRGVGKSAAVNRVLREMVRLLRTRGLRMLVAWTCSESNLCDRYTRMTQVPQMDDVPWQSPRDAEGRETRYDVVYYF